MRVLKLIGLFVVTAGLEHLFAGARGAAADVVLLAEPTTILAVASVITAATAVTTGTMNYLASQDAAAHAKSLEDQQAAQLKADSDKARQQAAAQAITGQTFGEDKNSIAATGLGFKADAAPTGAGRAALTGMN